eukprot:CAMPEP_0178934502 /NCGR_PEP_ID=MMETSP0786-20121207/23898_1 /TAXON_ID=186022 /ORGANISM="Thalassionema frauenfeldii, Strain CCMP 1798" /LENGTH=120 /DNA_ID=CAMNT_0020612291 /DNA_START=275 /DNA_END=636 /DNA_ORIENTATION=-
MDLESDKNPNQEYTDKFTDNKSWPLSEWNELVTILRNEINPEELGPAMTFRAKEVETESNMNVGFFARPLVNPASYFHVVALKSTTLDGSNSKRGRFGKQVEPTDGTKTALGGGMSNFLR